MKDEFGGALIGFGVITSTSGFNRDFASHLKEGDKVALVSDRPLRKIDPSRDQVRAWGTPYCWGSLERHYRIDKILNVM